MTLPKPTDDLAVVHNLASFGFVLIPFSPIALRRLDQYKYRSSLDLILSLPETAAPAPPDGVPQDEQGNDRQGDYPLDANLE